MGEALELAVALIQVAGSDVAAGSVHQLSAGQSIVVGACRCHACDFDLSVNVPTGDHLAVRIDARDDHWRLDNLGDAELNVRDLEQPFQMIALIPGRAALVIPFELAEVVIDRYRLMIIFGPEPSAGKPAWPRCPEIVSSSTIRAVDPAATYFDVLVALCRAKLTGSQKDQLPTSREVADDLCGQGIELSARAVDAHISYLIEKLRVAPRHARGTRRSWRKEALVAAALQQGIVSPTHLRKMLR